MRFLVLLIWCFSAVASASEQPASPKGEVEDVHYRFVGFGGVGATTGPRLGFTGALGVARMDRGMGFQFLELALQQEIGNHFATALEVQAGYLGIISARAGAGLARLAGGKLVPQFSLYAGPMLASFFLRYRSNPGSNVIAGFEVFFPFGA